MTITTEEFGTRLKTAREARGLTQQAAADAVGIAQPRWAEYESGRVAPSVVRVLEMIEVLGLDRAILFPASVGQGKKLSPRLGLRPK